MQLRLEILLLSKYLELVCPISTTTTILDFLYYFFIRTSVWDVPNFSSNNEPATDLCQHENHRDERGTLKNIPMIQKVQYPSQIQAKPINGQQHFDVSSKKRQRRKKLSLPIHNPGTRKETSFRKRLRRKHQLSLENFFAAEDQELRF